MFLQYLQTKASPLLPETWFRARKLCKNTRVPKSAFIFFSFMPSSNLAQFVRTNYIAQLMLLYPLTKCHYKTDLLRNKFALPGNATKQGQSLNVLGNLTLHTKQSETFLHPAKSSWLNNNQDSKLSLSMCTSSLDWCFYTCSGDFILLAVKPILS